MRCVFYSFFEIGFLIKDVFVVLIFLSLLLVPIMLLSFLFHCKIRRKNTLILKKRRSKKDGPKKRIKDSWG